MTERVILSVGALLVLLGSLAANRAGSAAATTAAGWAATPEQASAELRDPDLVRRQRAIDNGLRTDIQVERWRRARGQLMAAGLALKKKGQYRAAIDQFQAVLERFPNDEKALGELAACWLALGDFARAEPLADRTATVDPRELRAFRMRAEARAGLGRLSEALVDLEHVLRITPGDRDTRVLQAEMYEKAGMPHHALRAWTHVRKATTPGEPLGKRAEQHVTRLIRTIMTEKKDR